MKNERLEDFTEQEYLDYISKYLLHKRFTIEEITDITGYEVGLIGGYLDAENICDYNLAFSNWKFDVKIYCLIDRYGRYYITNIEVEKL